MENMVIPESLKIYNNKKVFITGHTGFKGSWLSKFLLSLGAEVYGYSLPPNTSPSHFDLFKSEIQGEFGNILDAATLIRSINKFKPDIIFHLAAQPLVRESYARPVETYQTNVIGTLNVLQAFNQCAETSSLLCITTDKVYENKEWIFPYREADRLGGHDMYSSSKACCEVLIDSYRKSFFRKNKNNEESTKLVASARAGNVIAGGDWSTDRLIPDLVKSAVEGKKTEIRNPSAVRPWQHVMDCLHGYLLLGGDLLNGNSQFADSWNFGPYNNDFYTVEMLINHCKNHWNEIETTYVPDKENYHEAGLLVLDISKSIHYLNWKPVWNTETAIRKTINWYKSFYSNHDTCTQTDINEFISTIK